MPELPEVETVMRGLMPHVQGQMITAVDASVDRLRTPIKLEALRKRCVGRQILGLERRAKYIIVKLDDATELVLHLGMTGSFRIETAAASLAPHDRVWWTLGNGTVWRFNDPRRFGSVWAVSPERRRTMLEHLGPEPLSDSFNPDYLHRISRARKRSIKCLIMDQEFVVGVGNIYANEALFRARIRPTRRAGQLSKAACERIVREIKTVLGEAIELGGTTISDFKTPDGKEGKFRLHLEVYGRHDKPCRTGACGETVKRVKHGGRSTFYCPRCQR